MVPSRACRWGKNRARIRTGSFGGISLIIRVVFGLVENWWFFLQYLTNKGLLFIGSVCYFCLDGSHDTQIGWQKVLCCQLNPKKILEVKWRNLFKVGDPTSYKWSFGSPYKWPHVQWCNWGKKPYSCFLGPPCWNMWGPHWPHLPPSKFDAKFRHWQMMYLQLMVPEIQLLYMQILLKHGDILDFNGFSRMSVPSTAVFFPLQRGKIQRCWIVFHGRRERLL